MLRVSIPSNGPAKISFSNFLNYLLPMPPRGLASTGDNDAVLLFDDEEQIMTYMDKLRKLTGSQKKISNEIIRAITNH